MYFEEINSEMVIVLIGCIILNGALFVEVASSAEGDLKLINGANPFEGRVEIYHNNQWGTVCYDAWDNDDAKVVCKQLGYAYGMATSSEKYGNGTGKVWMDDVSCEGTEVRLSDCTFVGWETVACESDATAGVICNLDIYSSREGAVRLVNGSSLLEGRVEILHNNTWKGVCSNNWGKKDARVVCKQLGFVDGTAVTHTDFGQHSSAVWVNNVTCQGMETRLEYCPIKSWEDSNCDKSAGVSCTIDGSTRLRPITSDRSRLEVFYNGTWGTVCMNYWTNENMNVALRQFGFPYGGGSSTGNIGLVNSPIWMTNVSCLGTEGRLNECSFTRESDCSHDKDLSIQFTKWYEVRLVGGKTKREGRVEIMYPGPTSGWATVCANKWDDRDAAVVCRQLGYTGGLARGMSFFGEGVAEIKRGNVGCNGSEFLLYHCQEDEKEIDSTAGCSHSNDAGVICEPATSHRRQRIVFKYYITFGIPEPIVITKISLDLIYESCLPQDTYGVCVQVDGSIRLVNGTSPLEGRIEVLHNGIWGTVCNTSWDNNDTLVACRELGYMSGGSLGNFGQGSGLTWMDNVKCRGDESQLSNCDFNGWGNENCSHMQDVSIICTPDCNDLQMFLPNGSSSFDEGETATFRCNSSCTSSEETLYWNIRYTPPRGYSFLYTGEKLSLTLQHTHNNFNLKCGTAFNIKNATLSVSFKPTTISLTPNTKSYNVTEGKDFGPISCSASCNPDCSYKWTNMTNRNLSFISISRTDDGSYTCTARNRLGDITSQPIIINVQFPPNATTTKKLSEENNNITLLCDAKGNPDEYSYHGWIHKYEGRIIRDYTFPGLQGNRTLLLTTLSHMDDGEYYCRVSNGIVNIMDDVVQTGLSTVLEIKVAPYGFEKIYSARAKLGEQFIFRLPFLAFGDGNAFEILNISSAENVKSSPRFQFYTVKDMHDVNMYSSVVRKHGFQFIINITQFAEDDAGTYVITLVNEIGRRNCQLNIEKELTDSDGNSNTIMIVSIVGGSVVLLTVIVVIIIWLRRGSCRHPIEQKSEENYNSVNGKTAEPHQYDRIKKPEALYLSLREDPMKTINGMNTIETENPQSIYHSIREEKMESIITAGNTIDESQDGYLNPLRRSPEYSYADLDAQ